MALQLLDHGSAQYRQMIALREQLLRKPLGLSISPEEMQTEANNILIGYTDDGKMEGCCMLVPVDADTIQLRQMAVLAGLQGKGIGRTILHFAENIARDKGYKKMVMHARASAVGFYEKNEYQKIGEPFYEVTLPHYLMEKKL